MSYSASITTILDKKKTIYFASHQGGNAGANASEACKAFLKTGAITQKKLDKIICDYFEKVKEETCADDCAEIDFDSNKVQFTLPDLEEYAINSEDKDIFQRILESKATLPGHPVEKLHRALKMMIKNTFAGKFAESLHDAMICCTIQEAASFFQPFPNFNK